MTSRHLIRFTEYLCCRSSAKMINSHLDWRGAALEALIFRISWKTYSSSLNTSDNKAGRLYR